MSHSVAANNTESILPCLANHSLADADEMLDLEAITGIFQMHSLRCKLSQVCGFSHLSTLDI